MDLSRFKFIQANCEESNKIDLHQANLIQQHSPDIVVFELPASKKGPGTIFNQFETDQKPLDEVMRIIDQLKKYSVKEQYALSDVYVWQNIMNLWQQNHNTMVYYIDTPAELRKSYLNCFKEKYPKIRKDWLFWAYLLVREVEMTHNLEIVLAEFPKKKATVAVLLQSIHWKHVKFLLTKPSNDQIWEFYFGKFPDISQDNIAEKIKERCPIIYKYWNKY